MSTLQIPDSSVTSSPMSHDPVFSNPTLARIGWAYGGWRSPATGLIGGPSVTIDLLKSSLVNGIEIEGCKEENHWVTLFQVMYKKNDKDSYWKSILNENGQEFVGNQDSVKSVVHLFKDSPVVGSLFKIIPTGYSGSVCFKVELLGCKEIPVAGDDLAMENSVTSSEEDSTGSPIDLPIENAVKNMKIRGDFYENAARIPADVVDPQRPVLTVDLGEDQELSSVELVAPRTDPVFALVPEGLWLFDIVHGGNDLGEHGNHAILGSTLEYGDGFDGRKKGALSWPDTSVTRTVIIPTTPNSWIDLNNGFAIFSWVYIQSNSISNTVSLFNVKPYGNYNGFYFYIKSTGYLGVNYAPAYNSNSNPSTEKNAYGANIMQFDKWQFVGFMVNCKSETGTIILNGKPVVVFGLPCSSATLFQSGYGMIGDTGPFVGRMSCLQTYRRSLSYSEIYQAMQCPWLRKFATNLFSCFGIFFV